MPRRANVRPDEPGRARILDAAVELFARKGFEATSIAEIGAAADISKSVLYHHFGSKPELYVAILEAETAELVARVEALLRRTRGSSSQPATLISVRDLTIDLARHQVTVRGAGPWHTVLRGVGVGVFGNGAPNPSSAVHVSDLAIFGATTVRDDSTIDSGFGGSLGGGSTIRNVWIEHVKVGMWFDGPADGLTVDGARIQNVFADGINLHNGLSHVTIANTFVRNTGDDGMAMWSDSNANHHNTFTRNTVSVPLLANGFAIYGGHDNTISDSVGASVPGSRIAEPGSGTSSMSDSEIPCQPRIEEPSKPSPSSNASAPNARRGSVMCCHVPSRSQNLRSTIDTRVSAAHSSASRASGSVAPPLCR